MKYGQERSFFFLARIQRGIKKTFMVCFCVLWYFILFDYLVVVVVAFCYIGACANCMVRICAKSDLATAKNPRLAGPVDPKRKTHIANFHVESYDLSDPLAICNNNESVANEQNKKKIEYKKTHNGNGKNDSQQGPRAVANNENKPSTVSLFFFISYYFFFSIYFLFLFGRMKIHDDICIFCRRAKIPSTYSAQKQHYNSAQFICPL